MNVRRMLAAKILTTKGLARRINGEEFEIILREIEEIIDAESRATALNVVNGVLQNYMGI